MAVSCGIEGADKHKEKEIMLSSNRWMVLLMGLGLVFGAPSALVGCGEEGDDSVIDGQGTGGEGGDADGSAEPGGDADGSAAPGGDADGSAAPGGDADGSAAPGGDADGSGEPQECTGVQSWDVPFCEDSSHPVAGDGYFEACTAESDSACPGGGECTEAWVGCGPDADCDVCGVSAWICLACESGAQRPDEDGCNTCTCTETGDWACTEEACPEPMCVDDPGCAPVYDDRCNCVWVCLPPNEIPESCAGAEPCPSVDMDAIPECACDNGQCVTIQ